MSNEKQPWGDIEFLGQEWDAENKAMKMKIGVPLEDQPHIPSLESIREQME